MSQTDITFQEEELLPRLISEFGYSQTHAPIVAGKLAAADPDIKHDFWCWWQTGVLDSTLDIEGYNAARLILQRRFLKRSWKATCRQARNRRAVGPFRP